MENMTKQELINELEKRDKEIVKLNKDKNTSGKKHENLEISYQQLLNIFDSMDEAVYVSDPKTYELLYVNNVLKDMWGDHLGEKCYKVLQGLDSPCPFCTNDNIFGKNLGKTYVWEIQNEVTNKWYKCIDKAIEWTNGRKVRYEMAIDITKTKEDAETISRQLEDIISLSTPVIQIWDGIIVAPLIGTLDSDRTYLFMEQFLNSITRTNSQVALLDITGVPTIDTQTAQHLIEAITAARLLGAEVILTGVKPAIAQTLVHLGIDLSDVKTLSSLRGGLLVALKKLDYEVTKNDNNS